MLFHLYIYIYIYNLVVNLVAIVFKYVSMMWVLVNSTGKVSDGCIRNLGFNLRLHQKLIGVLV